MVTSRVDIPQRLKLLAYVVAEYATLMALPAIFEILSANKMSQKFNLLQLEQRVHELIAVRSVVSSVVSCQGDIRSLQLEQWVHSLNRCI